MKGNHDKQNLITLEKENFTNILHKIYKQNYKIYNNIEKYDNITNHERTTKIHFPAGYTFGRDFKIQITDTVHELQDY